VWVCIWCIIIFLSGTCIKNGSSLSTWRTLCGCSCPVFTCFKALRTFSLWLFATNPTCFPCMHVQCDNRQEMKQTIQQQSDFNMLVYYQMGSMGIGRLSTCGIWAHVAHACPKDTWIPATTEYSFKYFSHGGILSKKDIFHYLRLML
jgi:hypothetical protein